MPNTRQNPFCNNQCYWVFNKGPQNPLYGSRSSFIPYWHRAEYSGIVFRSRWEAKLAKWFDENQISWQYEPRRFCFADCTYLPDFYLPEYAVYIEVKGYFDRESMKRINRFLEKYGNLMIVDEKIVDNLNSLRFFLPPLHK